METLIDSIVNRHKSNNTYVQLSGWTIKRLYVTIRKMIDDDELYHTDNIFNVIFDNKKIIVCDLNFRVLKTNMK